MSKIYLTESIFVRNKITFIKTDLELCLREKEGGFKREYKFEEQANLILNDKSFSNKNRRLVNYYSLINYSTKFIRCHIKIQRAKNKQKQ